MRTAAPALLALGLVLALPAGEAAATLPASEPRLAAPPARASGEGSAPARRPQAAPPRRLPQTLQQPLNLRPATPPPRLAEPAPVPNRSIEPPRDRLADPLAPSLEPMLLPPDRRLGMTFGREHLRETGPDRPFDNLVPGARLRIPFEGTPPR